MPPAALKGVLRHALPREDSGKSLCIPTLLCELEFWWTERETYPSWLEVERIVRIPKPGRHIRATVRSQIPIIEDGCSLSEHKLIDERLTESTADRLTAALQRLGFNNALCYMLLLYLMFYDLERAHAGKISLLLTNGDAQRVEHGQDAIPPLWSLDDVLRFWDTFDGRLNEGFPPPEGYGRGHWSYHTIPPKWISEEISVYKRSASEHFPPGPSCEVENGAAQSISSSFLNGVPVMVPAPWKNWVENLVALLQVPEQHGLHINISLGAAVAESQAAYSATTPTIHIGPSTLTENNLVGAVSPDYS
jgi:hypothetical protein